MKEKWNVLIQTRKMYRRRLLQYDYPEEEILFPIRNDFDVCSCRKRYQYVDHSPLIFKQNLRSPCSSCFDRAKIIYDEESYCPCLCQNRWFRDEPTLLPAEDRTKYVFLDRHANKRRRRRPIFEQIVPIRTDYEPFQRVPRKFIRLARWTFFQQKKNGKFYFGSFLRFLNSNKTTNFLHFSHFIIWIQNKCLTSLRETCFTPIRSELGDIFAFLFCRWPIVGRIVEMPVAWSDTLFTVFELPRIIYHTHYQDRH